MNKQLLKALLEDGTFTTILFKKKDGTLRALNGRVNVKHKGEVTPTFTGGYVLFHTKQGFRKIGVDSIISINAKQTIIKGRA